MSAGGTEVKTEPVNTQVSRGRCASRGQTSLICGVRVLRADLSVKIQPQSDVFLNVAVMQRATSSSVRQDHEEFTEAKRLNSSFF